MATPFRFKELVTSGRIHVCKGNVTAGESVKLGKQTMASYTIASGDAEETIFIPLDPTQETAIHMSHHATDTPTISATLTVLKTDDLELSTVNYFTVYDGSASPYAAGDTRPLIGLKIVADPATDDIKIDIIQTRRSR